MEIGSRRRNSSGIMELIAKVLVVGGPVAYALGRAYAEGYWRAIGITSTVMGRGFDEYAYFFFVMIVNLALIPFRWVGDGSILLAIAAILAVFILVAVLTWTGQALGSYVRREIRVARRKSHLWLRRRKHMRASVITAAGVSGMLALAAIVGLYAIFVLVLCVALSQWLGAQQAEQMIGRLRSGQNGFETVIVPVEGIDREARMLECSDRRCVVFINNAFIAVAESDVRWKLPPLRAKDAARKAPQPE